MSNRKPFCQTLRFRLWPRLPVANSFVKTQWRTKSSIYVSRHLFEIFAEPENILLTRDGVIKLDSKPSLITPSAEFFPSSVSYIRFKKQMWEIQIIKREPRKHSAHSCCRTLQFWLCPRLQWVISGLQKKIVKMQCHTIKAVACMNIHE